MSRHRSGRGMTLLELMIALLVSTVVIAASTVLLTSQQKSFQRGAGVRAVQESGRLALEEITRTLRSAGYGMDPALVFDFGDTQNVPRSAFYKYGKGYLTSFECNDPVRCRDSADGGSDSLVFYSRDPMFSRPVISADPVTVTVRGELRQPLLRGQVLQVMCLIDPKTRVYVTVDRFVAAPAAPNALNPVAIPLQPGRSQGGIPAFPFENEGLSDGCFGSGAAVVTRVDRYRYYVETYDEAGNVVPAQTAGSRPYLMLDQGLFDEQGNAVRLALAPDVEDLQVAWLYPPAVAGGGARVVGQQVGVNAANEAFNIRVDVPPPRIGDALDAKTRTTGSPANIVGAKLAIVVRSSDPDVNLTGDEYRRIPAVFNRPQLNGLGYYRRTVFETTAVTPNLGARAVIYPMVDPAGQPGMNLGGG